MELILQINSFINGIVWGPIMLFLLVGTGVYLTVRCGCLQARKFGFMLRSTLGSLFRKTVFMAGLLLLPLFFGAEATFFSEPIADVAAASMSSFLFLRTYPNVLRACEGFRQDPIYECCLLAEETGELISAVRKHTKGGSIGSGSEPGEVKLELADVLIYLCSIANMHGIDLEEAFREKEEINKQRVWKRI